MRMFILLPALLLAALCAPSAHAQEERPWPFGVSGRGAGFSGLDLWNLGILGAKAADADQPLPTGERLSGQRVRTSGGRGKDLGPKRLAILVLHPEGPAKKAGLRSGDVLIGVFGKEFDEGALDPLARALLAAESSKNGKLPLLIERGRGDAIEKITVDVSLPSAGKSAEDPTRGAQRDLILGRALDWLAEQQQGDGSFAETLGGRNGAVVMTSLAGLAWVGGGSLPGKGRHGANVKKAFEWVAKNLDAPDPFPGERGGANWDQSNWGWAYAGLFFGELLARDSDSKLLRGEMQRIADRLIATQEQSGGWAHGPGGPNALGYVELNIVTGLAVSALGLAHRAGLSVNPEAIAKAEKYLEDSSSGGGVGYSTKDGQRGQGNIGRSAAVWLGLQNLGRGGQGFGAAVKAYTAREAGKVQDGHASLMQHIFFAGVAAQSLGAPSTKEYWEAVQRDLVLARAPDGSLQPRPWHESLSMGSNSDVSAGEVWTTANWACILAADPQAKAPRGLPGLQGRLGPKKR